MNKEAKKSADVHAVSKHNKLDEHFAISENTLKSIETSIQNLNEGKVSKEIYLSEFNYKN